MKNLKLFTQSQANKFHHWSRLNWSAFVHQIIIWYQGLQTSTLMDLLAEIVSSHWTAVSGFIRTTAIKQRFSRAVGIKQPQCFVFKLTS